ncbi:VOC family protein [Shewanella sp. SR44-3]|uniref:VOC family protein n=1 Tax=Shewanella sp. SR44-3 TaxID=2760936 RepID=UPI0015FD00FE|nr:VOC family protein [Shewanella sp. SR44-3]MBB1268511.1 VOC family protein [Shewanella sp. SR44-3]
MKVTHYRQGEPCWAELASHDWQGAKAFYQKLFGWNGFDMPMPEGNYTMLQIDNDDVAALYQMPVDMVENSPTHWTVYFAVDDLPATVAKVQQAGGQLLIGPHAVGEAGKMAVFADPEGSRFAVWEAINHIGIKRSQENNALCWVELACRDTAKAKDFYSQAFGWQCKLANMPAFEYNEWYVDERAIGGMMAMTEEWGDMPTHWMLYFAVEDCDAIAAKAAANGGKICVPPTDIDNVGRFSVLADPQGGVFSVITLKDDVYK